MYPVPSLQGKHIKLKYLLISEICQYLDLKSSLRCKWVVWRYWNWEFET